MALKYVIKDFRDEGDKKYVGFTVTDEKQSINQDAIVKQILFMGNMTASNCSLQGVLKA